MHKYTYVDGISEGVRRAAAWLRDHGEDPEFSMDRGGDNNYWFQCPDVEKLATQLDRFIEEFDNAKR